MADVVKLVDRGVSPNKRYQVFDQNDLSAGDILLLKDSLGVIGKKVSITADAELVIRLNSYKTVYPIRQHFNGLYEAGGFNIAQGVRVKDTSTAAITIMPNETLIFNNEIPINDIEIISTAGDFKINAHAGSFQPTAAFPLFQLNLNTSGVAQLPTSLTINSITVEPTFVYYGGNADATEITASTYGETLPAQGSGGSFNQGSPGLGSDDDSYNGSGTRYYQDSGTTYGDITTEDFVIEMVYLATGTIVIPFAKRSGGSGFNCYTSPNVIGFNIDNGVDAAFSCTATATNDTWNHVMIFADRSGNMRCYVNSSSGSATDISSAGSITSSAKFTIGAYSDNSFISTTNIAYLSMWKQDAWLDTDAQADIALERFYRYCGIYPSIATGTAMPTSYSRATSAYIDKTESTIRKLYRVPSGWPRVCRRWESDGSTEFSGFLSEPAATNLVTHSEDLSAASWIKGGNLTVNSDATTAPDGLTTADAIVENSANNYHYISDQISITSGKSYIFSAFMKSANRNWVRLHQTNVDEGSYFDLDNCALGSAVGSPDDRGIEDWGNGWCRCWIRITADASGTQVFRIRLAEADGDVLFTGLDQDSIYAWGAMVVEKEASEISYPKSYIKTSGATATRNRDILYYKGDDGNVANTGVGTVEAKTLTPDANFSSQFLVSLSDGDSANDRIALLHTYLASDSSRVIVADGGVTQADFNGDTDISDGDSHTVRLTWTANDVNMYVDDTAEGTPDTSCTIPNDLDRIYVGVREVNTLQAESLVGQIKIWGTVRAP